MLAHHKVTHLIGGIEMHKSRTSPGTRCVDVNMFHRSIVATIRGRIAHTFLLANIWVRAVHSPVYQSTRPFIVSRSIGTRCFFLALSSPPPSGRARGLQGSLHLSSSPHTSTMENELYSKRKKKRIYRETNSCSLHPDVDSLTIEPRLCPVLDPVYF